MTKRRGQISRFTRMVVVCVIFSLLLSSLAPLGLAFQDEVRIRVDGTFVQIRYGQPPVIVGERTLVPLRDVMTHLGFTVEWDEEARIAYLTKPGYVIAVPLAGNAMLVNDRRVPLDVPAQTINGRMLVPLRAIVEAVGLAAHWIEEVRIVDIRTDGSRHGSRHEITWRFSGYREPNFHSQRMGSFDPQTVTVRYETGDGWALVATHRGDLWVYLPANRRFIERPTGLFLQRGDALPSTVLSPQVVRILAQQGNWLQISTWQGARWIHLNFTPPTSPLDDLLQRYGNRVSVYFENLETGFIYRYNAGRVYAGASVPKAFFSMYIYEKADRGETDLDRRIPFPAGGTLSQREMLRRNLMYSCNHSTIGLRNFHGSASYRRWVANLGGNPDWVAHNIMGSRLTIDETAMFAWAIYNYIESDAPHSNEFKRHLLNNQIPFIVSDYPIASKTGWTSTVQHDMAIVYADSPYMLIILSSRISTNDFAIISRAFQQFNDTWFVYESGVDVRLWQGHD